MDSTERLFDSIGAAVQAGYKVYEETADGTIVRARTPRGWMTALVRRPAPKELELEKSLVLARRS